MHCSVDVLIAFCLKFFFLKIEKNGQMTKLIKMLKQSNIQPCRFVTCNYRFLSVGSEGHVCASLKLSWPDIVLFYFLFKGIIQSSLPNKITTEGSQSKCTRIRMPECSASTVQNNDHRPDSPVHQESTFDASHPKTALAIRICPPRI